MLLHMRSFIVLFFKNISRDIYYINSILFLLSFFMSDNKSSNIAKLLDNEIEFLNQYDDLALL